MSANSSSEIDALNDTLSAVFSALSDPTRRAMLARLSQGEASVSKIDGVQLKQAVDWRDQYKQLWEGRLDCLDAYLVELHASESAAKSTKAKKNNVAKDTTKKIAPQALNTLPTAKNSLKKQAKPEKSAQKAPKTLKSPKVTVKPQEKNDDNALNNLQQQIGFDF